MQCIREKMDLIDIEGDTIDAEVLNSMCVTNVSHAYEVLMRSQIHLFHRSISSMLWAKATHHRCAKLWSKCLTCLGTTLAVWKM